MTSSGPSLEGYSKVSNSCIAWFYRSMLTDKQKITFLKAFTGDKSWKTKQPHTNSYTTAPAKYKWAVITEQNCFSKIRKESKIFKLNCVWGLQNKT